ncbi:MAG: DUF86 domain-containing protein [Candidatus Lokiarchaeota archaeon]|nr:DUF86 domain-containing protein [Candidatus Lokiarchaeota archaeon]
MKDERIARYKIKFQYIVEHICLADSLVDDPTTIEQKALYYCILTSIESAMDIVSMATKDLGSVPKGDSENIQFLTSESIISLELGEHLSKCNRLRNVLVHQYNGIDKDIVLDSYPDVKKTLEAFVEIMERYVNDA